MAVGLGYGIQARSLGQQISQQYDAQAMTAGQRDQSLQWVFYGIGAAAVATGTFLYLHGRKLGAHTESLSAGVAYTGQGGSVLVGGQF